jgi:hypothetical protein
MGFRELGNAWTKKWNVGPALSEMCLFRQPPQMSCCTRTNREEKDMGAMCHTLVSRLAAVSLPHQQYSITRQSRMQLIKYKLPLIVILHTYSIHSRRIAHPSHTPSNWEARTL